jgi:enamine deaminase RidA (YjgF/YER057c/UK114 family)
MTGHITAKLAELGLSLPVLATPKGAYLPFRRHGDLVFLAGQTSSRDGQPVFTGPVGDEVTVEQGHAAARLCGLNLLAALSAACDGDLDRVTGCIKVNGYVLAKPGFEQVPAVINGASELIVAVFGDAGRHARTSVGVATLPGSASVEVEAVFSIRAAGV